MRGDEKRLQPTEILCCWVSLAAVQDVTCIGKELLCFKFVARSICII